jgi:hypothetical protein
MCRELVPRFRYLQQHGSLFWRTRTPSHRAALVAVLAVLFSCLHDSRTTDGCLSKRKRILGFGAGALSHRSPPHTHHDRAKGSPPRSRRRMPAWATSAVCRCGLTHTHCLSPSQNNPLRIETPLPNRSARENQSALIGSRQQPRPYRSWCHCEARVFARTRHQDGFADSPRRERSQRCPPIFTAARRFSAAKTPCSNSGTGDSAPRCTSFGTVRRGRSAKVRRRVPGPGYRQAQLEWSRSSVGLWCAGRSQSFANHCS